MQRAQLFRFDSKLSNHKAFWGSGQKYHSLLWRPLYCIMLIPKSQNLCVVEIKPHTRLTPHHVTYFTWKLFFLLTCYMSDELLLHSHHFFSSSSKTCHQEISIPYSKSSITEERNNRKRLLAFETLEFHQRMKRIQTKHNFNHEPLCDGHIDIDWNPI